MLTILLALASAPEAFRAPTPCSAQAPYEALGPLHGASGVPTNASLWFRESPIFSDPSGLPVVSGPAGAIDVEAFRTGTRLDTLLELRPRSLLAPGTTYRVATSAGELTFTTGGGEDRSRPDPPVIEETRLETDICRTGIRVAGRHDAKGEPMIYLAEGGELFNVATVANLVVPTAPDEEIVVSMVAMDLAGNRSVPSVEVRELATDAGCTCATRPSSWALLAMGCAILIARLGRPRRLGT
jgi:hypothetical protein